MTTWDWGVFGSMLVVVSFLMWSGYLQVVQMTILANQFMRTVEQRSAYAESIANEFLQRLEAIEGAVR